MTRKHTPGPWNLAPRKAKYQAIPANEQEQIELERINGVFFEALSIGSLAGQIAIVPLDESSEVNARLIAAAPDLLVACEIAQIELSKVRSRLPRGDTFGEAEWRYDFDRHLEWIRAAIMKATSEISTGRTA